MAGDSHSIVVDQVGNAFGFGQVLEESFKKPTLCWIGHKFLQIDTTQDFAIGKTSNGSFATMANTKADPVDVGMESLGWAQNSYTILGVACALHESYLLVEVQEQQDFV